jgi:hypothetical protein
MLYLTTFILGSSLGAIVMHLYCERDHATWRRIWTEIAREQNRCAYRLGFRDGRRTPPNCVDMKQWKTKRNGTEIHEGG